MEGTSPAGIASLEGTWHQAVKTNWAWKYFIFFFVGYNSGVVVAELFMTWYDSANGIIYIGNRAENVLIWVLSSVIGGLPMTFWINRNKVPVMLKFDDSGIAMQLKNGLVIEAGWNLVKRAKYHRQGKLMVVKLRGVVFPFTGNFSDEVNGALMARSAGRRQSPAQPAAPTLEDQVDSRLAADFRM